MYVVPTVNASDSRQLRPRAANPGALMFRDKAGICLETLATWTVP